MSMPQIKHNCWDGCTCQKDNEGLKKIKNEKWKIINKPKHTTWTTLMDEKITLECLDVSCHKKNWHPIKKDGKPAHVYHIMIAKKEIEIDEKEIKIV